MRLSAAAGTLLMIGLSACMQSTPAASAGSPRPSAAAGCRLPVWWPDAAMQDIHAGLLAIPAGGVTDAQTLSPTTDSSAMSSFQFFGATYFGAAGGWKRVNRALVSPDGKRYAYWTIETGSDVIHVLDLASGADTVVYTGATLYWPIAWQAEGIYLVDAVQPRQGAFQGLYLLDPAGGSPPHPVAGADRHMYQWGWVLIADGAAWGIDNADTGNGYTYSVIRLDLKTFQASTWVGPTNDMFWPIGVDLQHRLYAGDGQHLERVDQAGGMVELTSPGADAQYAIQGPGVEGGFVADARGVWLDGIGSVWLYADHGTGTQYQAGPADAIVYPAGPCT